MEPAESVPKSIEELLVHERSVRALARRLVLDEALADDVVQQTWLAALACDPRRIRSPSAWLSGVVRRIAFRLLRSEGRRAVREREAAGPESSAAFEETVRREAGRRELVDALFTLDEPWRATLYLRFFEELPRAEVARRSPPAATASAFATRGSSRTRAVVATSLPRRRGTSGRGDGESAPAWLEVDDEHGVRVFAGALQRDASGARSFELRLGPGDYVARATFASGKTASESFTVEDAALAVELELR